MLRKLGKEDVSAFSTRDRSQLVFDTLNEVAREVFLSRGWDFLVHHDGVIQIPAPITGVTGTWQSNRSIDVALTHASQAGMLPALASTDALASRYNHRYVAHLVATTSPTAPNTSFVVSSVQQRSGTAEGAGTYRFTLQGTGGAPPNTTESSGESETDTVEIVCPEVVWSPLTAGYVKSILGARFQEREVPIRLIDSSTTFEELITRPHEDRGTDPIVLAVGGVSTPTVGDFSQVSGNNETASPDPTQTAQEYWHTEPWLRAMVWPVPGAALTTYLSAAVAPLRKIDLTYEFIPQLSDEDSRFANVPEHVLDQIVNLAAASVQISTGESTPNLAAFRRGVAQDTLHGYAQRMEPDGGRPKSMRSLDKMGRGRSWPSLPRNFGTGT